MAVSKRAHLVNVVRDAPFRKEIEAPVIHRGFSAREGVVAGITGAFAPFAGWPGKAEGAGNAWSSCLGRKLYPFRFIFLFFSSKLYLNISQPEEPQPSPPLSLSSHPDKPNFFDSLVLLIVNFALL